MTYTSFLLRIRNTSKYLYIIRYPSKKATPMVPNAYVSLSFYGVACDYTDYEL